MLSEEEFNEMMVKAAQITAEYPRLRLRCMLAILKRVGKRRGELAQLELTDIKLSGENLSITFTVEKKRSKSLDQLGLRRNKQIPLTDPLTLPIIQYLMWMKAHQPTCRYLFPSTTNVFGLHTAFDERKHLSGRQILRLVQSVNARAWVHLFRETQGAEIARMDTSLLSVYKVMMRLDLESEASAWRYIRRYAVDVIKTE